jgi:hypothetical protein
MYVYSHSGKTGTDSLGTGIECTYVHAGDVLGAFSIGGFTRAVASLVAFRHPRDCESCLQTGAGTGKMVCRVCLRVGLQQNQVGQDPSVAHCRCFRLEQARATRVPGYHGPEAASR